MRREKAEGPRVRRTIVGEIPFPIPVFVDRSGKPIQSRARLPKDQQFELKATIVRVEGEPRKRVIPGNAESIVID